MERDSRKLEIEEPRTSEENVDELWLVGVYIFYTKLSSTEVCVCPSFSFCLSGCIKKNDYHRGLIVVHHYGQPDIVNGYEYNSWLNGGEKPPENHDDDDVGSQSL